MSAECVLGTFCVFRAGRTNINMYRGYARGRMSSRPTRPEGPRGAPESAGWAISDRDWGTVRPPGWPKDAISTPLNGRIGRMGDFLQGLGNGETPGMAQGCDFDPPFVGSRYVVFFAPAATK